MDELVAFTVRPEDAGLTLAQALRKHADSYSWERIRRMCALGKATLDGTIERDSARRLRVGEHVEFAPNRRRAPKATSDLTIVYEDAEIVVINKPAGVSSVPFEKRELGTAMDLLRAVWRANGRAHATAIALHVVHRIDKETSGLLMYAKSKRTERLLQSQLRAHEVERLYVCVAHGKVPSGSIVTRLVPDRGDGLRGTSRNPNLGKEAITHVEAKAYLPSEDRTRATVCEVRLETGKTHQIRIHLAERGHPLVGERVYIRDYLRRGGIPIDSERLLLHAQTLGFMHPRAGKLRFEVQPPPAFARALEKLRREHR